MPQGDASGVLWPREDIGAATCLASIRAMLSSRCWRTISPRTLCPAARSASLLARASTQSAGASAWFAMLSTLGEQAVPAGPSSLTEHGEAVRQRDGNAATIVHLGPGQDQVSASRDTPPC